MQVSLLEGEAVKTHNRFAGNGPGGPRRRDSKWVPMLLFALSYTVAMYDNDDDAGARVDEADGRNRPGLASVTTTAHPADPNGMQLPVFWYAGSSLDMEGNWYSYASLSSRDSVFLVAGYLAP